MKKSTDEEDPNAKVLRNRYAELLGLEDHELNISPLPKKKDNSQLRWYAFLFILFIVACAVWLLFDSYLDSQNQLPSLNSKLLLPKDNALKGAPNEADGKMVGGSDDLTELEQIVTARITESVSTSVEAIDKAAEPEPSEANSSNSRSTAMDQRLVLLVVLSTRSKEEAINRARDLKSKGFAGEVILSTSGYYGVVIRNNSTEDAQNTEQAMAKAGVITTKPYVMPGNRIKQWIFPSEN